MDFDSSSKFISSLAKFLQSLCNGYVEFNNGVEVIGHIYLNVDTGKKIDYVLNEKVCKTDENSVTFISNSFHAQPAEKPKPPPKNAKSSEAEKQVDAEARLEEDEIIIMDEPESKNIGTLPSRDSYHQQRGSPHSRLSRPSKRPHGHSFSSGFKQSSKHSRIDPSSFSSPNGAQHDTDSLPSESNSSSNFLQTHLPGDTSVAAASESDMSHLSKVLPQHYGDSSNDQNSGEERDVKPQLDSDMNIVQVKQEYNQSEAGDEEQESYDEPHDQGGSVFPGMPYDQYYGEGTRRGQRSDFGQMSSIPQGEFYQGGAGLSGEGGAGDSSDASKMDLLHSSSTPLWVPRAGCPVPGCTAQSFRFVSGFKKHWDEKHEPVVLKYHCSKCTHYTKRKSNLMKHFRSRHKEADIAFCVGKVEYQQNTQFLDPSPLTLDAVLE